MISATDMVDILGGGPAGLAAGWQARRRGLPFRIFEGSGEVGGNCRTLRLGNFLFDTGAHRLHDRESDVTHELKNIMGDELARVTAPSQIYSDGKFIDFPIHLGDLITKLDGRTLSNVIKENVRRRITRKTPAENFEQLAVNAYGPTLASRFLLNYSEKLWGKPCRELSTMIAGNRLKGLDVRAFLRATLLGNRINSTHLDGSFYYPKYGIGSIFTKIAGLLGAENIHYHSRITGIHHDGDAVRSFIVNNELEIRTERLVSTLPLTLMLSILNPAPDQAVLDICRELTYRHLVLAVFGVARERVSDNASIYFPDKSIPFTRLYESKNRSTHMAPGGETSIVLELPCQFTDAVWTMDDAALQAMLMEHLSETMGLDEREITTFGSFRIPYAYPVLEVGFEARARRLVEYMKHFGNLHLTGRSAVFQYVHIHDLFRTGRVVIDEIA